MRAAYRAWAMMLDSPERQMRINDDAKCVRLTATSRSAVKHMHRRARLAVTRPAGRESSVGEESAAE